MSWLIYTFMILDLDVYTTIPSSSHVLVIPQYTYMYSVLIQQ